jgi:hypothetical protein
MRPCSHAASPSPSYVQADDGRPIGLWRADAQAASAALTAEGLLVPVTLDPDQSYEIAVRTDRGEGGQAIKGGPPSDGEISIGSVMPSASGFADPLVWAHAAHRWRG